MTAFEFFFSLYGLVLGLSLAVLATGAARAFKHRRTIRVGWMTPLLGLFVALDIATFWDAAWVNFRHLPYSYGLLVSGLVVAGVYFVAASLVFPEAEDEAASLDDHFWAHRRTVLGLVAFANLLAIIAAFFANVTRTNGMALMTSYAVTVAIFLVLVGVAFLSRRRWLVVTGLGLHIAIYLVIALISILTPRGIVDDAGDIVVREAPAS